MPNFAKWYLWIVLGIGACGVIFQFALIWRLSKKPDTMKRCWNCYGEGNVNDYVCVVCDGSGEA